MPCNGAYPRIANEWVALELNDAQQWWKSAAKEYSQWHLPFQLKVGLSKNIEKLMIQLIEKHFKYNFASKLIVEATQINLQIF